MAVVTVKSTAITNVDSTPIVQNKPQISRGKRMHSIGVVTVTSGDSIGSQYRFARLRSGDRVASITAFWGAITSAAMNLGVYDVNGGAAVVSPNFATGAQALFASAQSIASANTPGGASLTYAVTSLANAEKRVWELLGFTADPGKEYDLTATLTAAATATAQLAVHLDAIANG